MNISKLFVFNLFLLSPVLHAENFPVVPPVARDILPANLQEQEDQKLTHNLLKRITGSVVAGGTLLSLGASNFEPLQKTGLNVGLGLASIPTFLAFVLSGKEREAASKLAIKVPFLGLLGSAVCSKFVVNKILGNIRLFNINDVAKKLEGLTPSQGAAIFITSALAYNLANPALNKLAHALYKKGANAYETIAEQLS